MKCFTDRLLKTSNFLVLKSSQLRARGTRILARGTSQHRGCLPFDTKIWLGSRKHNGKRFTSLPQNCHIQLRFESKRGANESGTEKLVNGKQHSVWSVPTGMNGLSQNVLLNFRFEFRKVTLPLTIQQEFPKFVQQEIVNL